MRILVIDIETRPNLAFVWEVWNTNVSPEKILDEKDVICFAAKWLDEKKVHYYSVFHDGKDKMVQAAWDLLDEADAVVHYNGKRFDVPHLNLEFLRMGLRAPSPFRQIDLLQTVRREFKFTHNKLDHVASKLGLGKKVEHEGFSLWIKCLEGNETAWAKMRRYNVGDVALTEKLYHRIRGWISNHPSFAAIDGTFCCPNCGSEELTRNGFQHTKTGKYQRYTCKRCGKHCRDTHRQASAEVTETSSW